MSAVPAFLGVVLLALVAGIGVFLLVAVAGKVFRLIGYLFAHTGRFIAGMVGDAFRFVGALLVSPVFAVLTLGSVVIGRWSASAHYARAFQSEVKSAALCVYRFCISHPLRFVGLGSVLDGYEKRLPEVVAQAPTRDVPKGGRKSQFNGYTIVGSLAGGGSGGKLYIAEPDELKKAALARAGYDVDQVVIKTFSLHEGSSLPQILRESRALEAAKQLGLVIEHELQDNDRFYYVMRYVPGQSLSELTRDRHAEAPTEGLGDRALREMIGYASDLGRTLAHYHAGGLWHKDVKPDNIIVHDGRAELVDLGLVTPLRSAMTLTTHGTEYFRDPELVRMALRGVKVHEVDGTRFDIYATGAVLYSVIENSFPAHGGLSQVSKRCPDAVKWVIRRAMTDYDKRYASIEEMLADLRHILAAEDVYAVKPASLPSRAGKNAPVIPEPIEPLDIDEEEPLADAVANETPEFARAASPTPPVPPAAPEAPRARTTPRLRVANWWTGRYELEGAAEVAPAPRPERPSPDRPSPVPPMPVARTPRRARPEGVSARDQLQNARNRAAERRRRARSRINSHPRTHREGGPGIGVAAFVGIAVVVFSAMMLRQAMVGGLKDMEQAAHHEEVLAVAPLEALPEPHASLVLLSDLREPVSDDVRGRLRALTNSAFASGLSVRGQIDASDLPPAIEPTDDTDLLAELRLLVGGRPIDAGDVWEDLRGYLGGAADVDAIWWIDREPESGEPRLVAISEQTGYLVDLNEPTPADVAEFASLLTPPPAAEAPMPVAETIEPPAPPHRLASDVSETGDRN